jgi:hypothetical protein
MPIRIKCPVCDYRIKAPEGAFGRRGQCPRCKVMIRIPSQEEIARRQQADAGRPDASSLPGEDTSVSGIIAEHSAIPPRS